MMIGIRCYQNCNDLPCLRNVYIYNVYIYIIYFLCAIQISYHRVATAIRIGRRQPLFSYLSQQGVNSMAGPYDMVIRDRDSFSFLSNIKVTNPTVVQNLEFSINETALTGVYRDSNKLKRQRKSFICGVFICYMLNQSVLNIYHRCRFLAIRGGLLNNKMNAFRVTCSWTSI